jgi:hypothetical protein
MLIAEFGALCVNSKGGVRTPLSRRVVRVARVLFCAGGQRIGSLARVFGGARAHGLVRPSPGEPVVRVLHSIVSVLLGYSSLSVH